MKPILDILKYIRMFQVYLGLRMYLIYALGIVASILEGIGILMLLPLLQSIDNSNTSSLELGRVNQLMLDIINYIGFSESMISILLLISSAFIFKGIITFGALGLTAYLLGQLLKEIKIKLFSNYSGMSYGYYTSKNSGDLINLINEQPTRALESFKQLSLLGSHLINTIILMSLAFMITFSFGAMAIVFGTIILILFLRMNSYVQNISRVAAKENGILTKWLIQFLYGFKYITSTNQISSLRQYVTRSISVLTSTQIKSGVASAFTQSVREPIAVVFIMAIVYVQIIVFELRLEPILVSIALFYRALNSTLAVQSAFQGTFQYIGSMELVHNEFIRQRNNQSVDGKFKLDKFKDGISIQNISFTYKNSENPVLNSISIDIPIKSSIAIVGESGSGKTTLVDLITLLHYPSSGQIIIDNVTHDKIKKSSWRKQIGYVSQDALIFDDTIANNITMWNTNQKERDMIKKMRYAARQANILEFIDSLPNGFNTIVGDRGILLSGGQKQRLFIARELFRNPSLLILDEATSALDSESEISIQKSIEKLKGKITVIIIAHRLSTIRKVDNIFLFDKGRIIEKGSYNSLKNKDKSRFKELIDLQVL